MNPQLGLRDQGVSVLVLGPTRVQGAEHLQGHQEEVMLKEKQLIRREILKKQMLQILKP